MDFRIFRPQFTGRDGRKHLSKTYHIEFKDHLGIRQRVIAYPHARDTEKLANRLTELVSHRRNGETLSPGLSKWLDSLPDKLRARFAVIDLLDATGKGIDRPLRFHLDGDTAGGDGTPGYKQELQARGVTYNHIRTTVPRIGAVLDGCGFILWRDLRRPGAAGDVTLYLGKLREAGEINGRTFCYYVRDLRTFCRWLAQRLERDVPLQDLRGVDNAEADADKRRELSPKEIIRLIAAAASSKRIRENLTGDERALLYRFAFETGMRPGQIRALTVGDFDLDTQARVASRMARLLWRSGFGCFIGEIPNAHYAFRALPLFRSTYS